MTTEGEITFMCFSDPATGKRRHQVDAAPPGESEFIGTRLREYGQQYRNEHGDFPDWLDDKHVVLLDRWRREHRAWYAEHSAQAIEDRRTGMRSRGVIR